MHFRFSLTLAVVFATFVLSIVFTIIQKRARPAALPLSYNPNDHQAGQPFRDPLGRFHLTMPSGWDPTLAADGLPTFHNGAAWAEVCLLGAAGARDAVDKATELFRPRFTTFNPINRGNTTIAGRNSHGLNADANTTTGRRVSVLITAQPISRHQFFVLISANPVNLAPQLNASVMALASSLHFEGH